MRYIQNRWTESQIHPVSCDIILPAARLDDAAVIEELIAVYAETFRLLAKSGK